MYFLCKRPPKRGYPRKNTKKSSASLFPLPPDRPRSKINGRLQARVLQSAPGVAVERRLGCAEATEGLKGAGSAWGGALGALMWITWERLGQQGLKFQKPESGPWRSVQCLFCAKCTSKWWVRPLGVEILRSPKKLFFDF